MTKHDDRRSHEYQSKELLQELRQHLRHRELDLFYVIDQR
jgi:hypothetical protein